MSDVRKVFVTIEVAERFDLSPAYLIRIAKEMNFSESEFRETRKHSYLFSEEAVYKLALRFHGDKKE